MTAKGYLAALARVRIERRSEPTSEDLEDDEELRAQGCEGVPGERHPDRDRSLGCDRRSRTAGLQMTRNGKAPYAARIREVARRRLERLDEVTPEQLAAQIEEAVLATNPITPENVAGHRGAARIKRRR
jgi:hypothetical protein